MDLEKLNAECAYEDKPTVKLRDLPCGEKFRILRASVIRTKYGQSILLDLENERIFLPKRSTEAVKQNIKYINEGGVHIRFTGVKDIGASHPVTSFEFC